MSTPLTFGVFLGGQAGGRPCIADIKCFEQQQAFYALTDRNVLGHAEVFAIERRRIQAIDGAGGTGACALLLYAWKRNDLLLLARRTGILGSEEQLAPIRQSDVAAIGAEGRVLGLVTIDHNLSADSERVLGEPAAE